MAHLTNVPLKSHSMLRKLTTMGLASLILLTGVGWYSSIKLESQPASINSSIPQNLAATELSTDEVALVSKDERLAPIAPTAGFAPFLDIVPSQDGTALFISAGGVGEVGGTVFANIGLGPGNPKGGHTMTFSNTIQTYITTASGFTPGVNTYAPLNITTTLGLDTGAVEFNRDYVPASTPQTINSRDNLLQLDLISTNTITRDTYIAVVPSFAPPGPPPLGHRLVGSAYSVRAAETLLVTSEPMNLRLYYNPITLAGADPHTLAIFAWDANPNNRHWINLGGTLFSTQQHLSITTTRFTTYALMSVPAWHDEFDEFSGLDFAQFNNVTFGGTPGNRTLVLDNPSLGSGSAVSQPITPTTPITHWGSLTFSRIVDPPTTTLTVDILDLAGTGVLMDVTSGTNLATIDPNQYPSLRLRVNMASTAAGKTPTLERWELSWQTGESEAPEQNKVYLPIVLKK